MMSTKELMTYREAYTEDFQAQEEYTTLYNFINYNVLFRQLKSAEQKKMQKDLQKARAKCHKTRPKYLELCKRYGVVPGSYL